MQRRFLLTGPVNLQEAKSLQPPLGSSTHLEHREKISDSTSSLRCPILSDEKKKNPTVAERDLTGAPLTC